VNRCDQGRAIQKESEIERKGEREETEREGEREREQMASQIVETRAADAVQMHATNAMG
jgi:hypothetical protein